MRRKKVLALFGTICLVAVLAMMPFGPCPAEAAPPMPAKIVLGTHAVGTGGYRLMSMVTESMVQKYPKTKWLSIPSGVDITRFMMVRTGETATTIQAAGAVWMIQEGLYNYASLKWGPQPIRAVYCPEHVGLGFAVRGDSPIKTGYDLKGKTVAIYPGSPNASLINQSFLAFFDLTWADVKPYKASTPPDGYRAVRDGHCDTAFFNAASSVAIELASMPCGIRWLDMPASNKAGWKRLREVYPPNMPKTLTRGPGVSKEHPAYIATAAYPEIVAYPSSPKATIYWITRALIETRPSWSQKNISLKNDWTMKKNWRLWEAGIAPMHKGAIEYYKEIGQWTPKRERINEERLRHQKELREYWNKVVKEAKAKDISAKDFPAYWTKMYNAKFKKHITMFN